MTDAERERIGRKLRALRIERALKQIPAAEKADLSVGTLQAIESNWYEVHDSNIEKYAAIFGTTVRKLLKPDEAVSPSDPRLDDLNDEHLDIARSYMRARRRVRAGIEVLLSNPPAEEALINLLLRLHALSPERISELDRWLTVEPHLFTLLEQIGRRIIRDPNYAVLVRQQLDVLEPHPIPPAKTPQRTPGTIRKRRTR